MQTGEQPPLWSIDDRMHLVRQRMASQIVIRSQEAYRLKLASGRRGVGQPAELSRMRDSEVIMRFQA